MPSSHARTARRRALLARHISSLLLMSVISIALFGCAASNRHELKSANLHDTLKALAETHHVCGAALAVIKNRQLDSIEYVTGCSPAASLNSDSVFQAASLSKPVFAYAVLKLVAQKKLELDVPVMQYLPQGYRHQFDPLQTGASDLVTDPRLQAITVRMVLNHTSGLPNWARGPLNFESIPGTKWHYSGEGYVLLQRAVEAVTGQPLDQFMTSHVFEPLAMNHSSFVWNERIARTVLPGRKANGTPRSTTDLKTPNAAFSLYTTAADYGKFLVTVMNDGEVIKQLSAAPVTVEKNLDLGWGLGWGIERHPENPTIWQWGNNTGYRAFVMASVQAGDGFVLLTNSENGLKLAQPMAQKILHEEHKLFQFSMLGDDIANLLCNSVRLCL